MLRLTTIVLLCSCVSVNAQERPIQSGSRIRVTTNPIVVVPGVVELTEIETRKTRRILASDGRTITVDAGAETVTTLRPSTRIVGTLARSNRQRLIVTFLG